MIVLLLTVVFFFACAGTGPLPAGQTKPEKKTAPEFSEDFDPLVLGEYEESQRADQPVVDTFNVDAFLAVGDAKKNPSLLRGARGYRVQILSTRDEEEARQVKRDILVLFDQESYVMFDDPYYKVRIGNFLSRFDAEELKEKAVQLGFSDAWVIQTIVKPPEELSPDDK